ncbi:MAG: aminotransferase DegT [Porticoccaceae bacterium]
MTPTEFDIRLSEPDFSELERDMVAAVLGSPYLTAGPLTERLEAAVAERLGRRHALAVTSSTMALWLILRAAGIGPGAELVAPSYGWRQPADAAAFAGAGVVLADVDYWSGCLTAEKVAARLTPHTQALLAANAGGHPAPWAELRALASARGLLLIEDSSEALGSVYQGKEVGSFGDCAILDFTQPGPIACSQGAVILTDDIDLASRLRLLRDRRLADRGSVVAGGLPVANIAMGELNAGLGLAQWVRLDEILARRKVIEGHYLEVIQSFEGIKPPYAAPEVEQVHWFLALVHLGTRFSRASRDDIVEDLATAGVEAAAYCLPLHRQARHFDGQRPRQDLWVTDKLADRALALPFHAGLDAEAVAFIVQTAKDASINVGAGSAIYL